MEHRHGRNCFIKTNLILKVIMNRRAWDRCSLSRRNLPPHFSKAFNLFDLSRKKTRPIVRIPLNS